MWKKSLKIGSMVLFIMALLAFAGCDNGTTSEVAPEDKPGTDIPDKPDTPDTPDNPGPVGPAITSVVVSPDVIDVAQLGQQKFTATVSGTGAYDKTVTWSIAVGEFEEKEDQTIITQAGWLKVDGGQTIGTTITVTATSNGDPGVSGSAEVTVVRAGARFSWSPKAVEVLTNGVDGTINDAGTSTGSLQEIYGLDVTIRDGDYVEGSDYYVRRVDNLVTGGTVTVSGSADEGTITVTLDGVVNGTTGPIGVTLYPSVLEGADKDRIHLEESELLFNVRAVTLITSLAGLEDIDAAPVRGGTPDNALSVAILDGDTEPRFTASISWSSVSLTSMVFDHTKTAVANVTLTADTTTDPNNFYTDPIRGITEAKVKAIFRRGNPTVSNLSVSAARVSFTLSYTPSVRIISATEAAFGTYLKNLVSNNVVAHGVEAPVSLRPINDNLYYTLKNTVVWTGLNGKYFVGAQVAEATITLPAKPGYTFTGSNIVNSDLAGVFNAVTTEGASVVPVVQIKSAGDSLVFGVSYYVPPTKITASNIQTDIATVLARPYDGGKPVTKLNPGRSAHFTIDSLVWSNLNDKSNFVAGKPPKARVILNAAVGYEFDSTLTTTTLSAAVSAGFAPGINSSTGATLIYNQGTRIEFDIAYTVVYKQITSLAGLDISTPLPSPVVHDVTVSGPAVTGSTEFASAAFVWGGLTSGSTGDFVFGTPATLDVTLVAESGYDFKTTTGGITNTVIQTKFRAGSVTPQVSLVNVDYSTSTAVELSFTLTYTVAKNPIATGTIDNTLLGTATTPAIGGGSVLFPTTQTITVGSTGVSSGSTGIWSGDADSDTYYSAGDIPVLTYTITPAVGYTLKEVDTDTLKADVESGTVIGGNPDSVTVDYASATDTLTIVLSWDTL